MSTNTEIKDEKQAKQPTVSGHVEPVVSWICAKEQLPDDFHNVIVKLKGTIITGAYYAYADWQPTTVVAINKPGDVAQNNHVEFSFEVTHWMEIPENMKSN